MPKPKKPKAYTNRDLSRHLKELAASLHDVVVEDNPENGMPETRARTKGQALAELVFEKALGSVEEKVDDEGRVSIVKHKPEAWALNLIFDRIEGRTPQATPENEAKIKAKDKVSELAKQRVNSLVGGENRPKPPSLDRNAE